MKNVYIGGACPEGQALVAEKIKGLCTVTVQPTLTLGAPVVSNLTPLVRVLPELDTVILFFEGNKEEQIIDATLSFIWGKYMAKQLLIIPVVRESGDKTRTILADIKSLVSSDPDWLAPLLKYLKK